jgi:putative RNA 2'-phosphotransferase
MEASLEKTSKLISYWLRHKPEDAGLIVDDFGWTSIDQLLKALHSRNNVVNLQDLIQLNKSFDKVRWEIDEIGSKIRATYGHSFPVLLDDKVKLPPETLYHGTAVKHVLQIAQQGLLPMGRQFVHLTETIDTALSVGARHGKPIIVDVDVKRLANDGWKFYQASDNVWLTSAIPVKYMNFRPWFPISNDSSHGLEELKREIGDRASHFIFPQLEILKMVWQSSASDDTLFQNHQTGECFMVHLTYTKKDQEIDGYPYIKKYKTIEEWLEKGLWNDQQYFYDLK